MKKTKKSTRNERLHSKNLKAAAGHCDEVRKRIVQERKAQGLSAVEVAKKMGISRPFYTQLEVGTRRMDLVYFLAICLVLQVEPGDLLK